MPFPRIEAAHLDDDRCGAIGIQLLPKLESIFVAQGGWGRNRIIRHAVWCVRRDSGQAGDGELTVADGDIGRVAPRPPFQPVLAGCGSVQKECERRTGFPDRRAEHGESPGGMAHHDIGAGVSNEIGQNAPSPVNRPGFSYTYVAENGHRGPTGHQFLGQAPFVAQRVMRFHAGKLVPGAREIVQNGLDSSVDIAAVDVEDAHLAHLGPDERLPESQEVFGHVVVREVGCALPGRRFECGKLCGVR